MSCRKKMAFFSKCYITVRNDLSFKGETKGKRNHLESTGLSNLCWYVFPIRTNTLITVLTDLMNKSARFSVKVVFAMTLFSWWQNILLTFKCHDVTNQWVFIFLVQKTVMSTTLSGRQSRAKILSVAAETFLWVCIMQKFSPHWECSIIKLLKWHMLKNLNTPFHLGSGSVRFPSLLCQFDVGGGVLCQIAIAQETMRQEVA